MVANIKDFLEAGRFGAVRTSYSRSFLYGEVASEGVGALSSLAMEDVP